MVAAGNSVPATETGAAGTGVDVNSEVVDVVDVGTVTTVVDAGIGVDASALGTTSVEVEAVTCP